MIRLFIFVVVVTLLSGCTSTFQSLGSGSNSGSSKFSLGLQKLEATGDTSVLENLAKTTPESSWGGNAKAVLSHHSKQQRKIMQLENDNKNLKKKNRHLTENLEKLNSINLEMEKRSP